MANKLFSVNRAVEYSSLRSKFEEHVFFSTGKIGYIIFSDTLANVTAPVADSYVSKGYHVGFLTDTSDAAHAYACPNNSFRAYLRALGTPINNLQKMINCTSIIISSEIGLTGNLNDFGLQYFVNVPDVLRIRNQAGIVGNIPAEIGNLNFSVGTTEMSFGACNIVGNIPPEIGNINGLNNLNLYQNKLTGSIPKEIFDISTLKVLNLYTNELTGTIPREIGNATELVTFAISTNQLTGKIPVELGNCTKLRTLQAQINNLSGYEAGAISQAMTVLDFVFISQQQGNYTNTGLPSADVDQIIIDVADSVLAANRAVTVNVSYNFPATAASISDPIARFGGISAKAYIISKGGTVTHS